MAPKGTKQEKLDKFATKDEIVWGSVMNLATARGWSLTDLARKSGVDRQLIEKYKTHQKGIGSENAEKLANAFGLTSRDLYSPHLPTSGHPVPIVAWQKVLLLFAPGVNVAEEAMAMREGVVYSRVQPGINNFATVMPDDSMEPRLHPLDRIVVNPDIECNSGNICLVVVLGIHMVRQLLQTDAEIRLHPLCGKYADLMIPRGGQVEYRLLGRVVEVTAEL